MSSSVEKKSITVALLGNPNTGKSTLFNKLAGVRQRVGNYPGVTVEKKVGRMTIDDTEFTMIDLPGTYSLAPRSPDEMVAVDVLLGRQTDVGQPDVVLAIVDASNIERNLYLVSQLLELGLPTVLVVNMMDVATQKGVELDIARLNKQVGVPCVTTQANADVGLVELKAAMVQAAQLVASGKGQEIESPFAEAFQQEVERLSNKIAKSAQMPRYLVERLLLDTSGYLAEAGLEGVDGSFLAAVEEARGRLADQGMAVPAVEATARYSWVGEVLGGVVTRPKTPPKTITDKIDKVLTHWFFGSVVFLVIMAFMFQAIFTWSGPLMDGVDGVFGALGDVVGAQLAAGPVKSLVVDGIIGGVGGVIIFLPQILILFLFIAILEDCGYMARAAYLMDRVMSKVGLSGKSFIPLLSSFACAIPGIMAARVIEDRRDRLTTILVAPLMSCSARLPVYAILISAFIPDTPILGKWFGLRALTMFSMYILGMVVAALVALVLKRTLLKGATPPFVMELPSYKMPSLRTVFFRLTERGWSFVKRAGTVILAVSVLIWAALYYPHNTEIVEAPFQARLAKVDADIAKLQGDELVAAEELKAAIDNEIAGAYLEQSFMGRAGKIVEPVVKPLGWDWRIGCAAIASFPAREVIVATLSVIYNMGEEGAEEEGIEDLEQELRDATWSGTDEKVYNIPVALSIMVFFALCAQCMPTLVVIRRECGSLSWALFAFVYMTSLAYIGALLTYQIGSRFF